VARQGRKMHEGKGRWDLSTTKVPGRGREGLRRWQALVRGLKGYFRPGVAFNYTRKRRRGGGGGQAGRNAD